LEKAIEPLNQLGERMVRTPEIQDTLKMLDQIKDDLEKT
jgi:hypothetical protein